MTKYQFRFLAMVLAAILISPSCGVIYYLSMEIIDWIERELS